MKEFYDTNEPYILFIILAIWCMTAGLLGVNSLVITLVAIIPTSIATYKFAVGIHDIINESWDIMIESFPKYINK